MLKKSSTRDYKNVSSDPVAPKRSRGQDSSAGQKGRRTKCTPLMDTWIWEITAMIFSTLCFVAIVAVLGAYDQKASPSFPKGLTLNTIVSILATGSKSSLLCMVGTSIGQLKWNWLQGSRRHLLYDLQSFDDASRGPWGSLLVLLHRPKKERLLISLGAIITIASLAFDPFMQQIVNLSTRQVSRESDGARVKQVDVPWRVSSGADIYSAMVSSLNAGIWTGGVKSDPICPSGNCTWPTFRSAGWCSKCEDFTSNATFVGCDVAMFNSSSHDSQKVACNIKIPDGYSINCDLQGVWGNRRMFEEDWRPGLTMKIPFYVIQPMHPRWGPYFNQTILGVRSPLSAVAMVGLSTPNAFTGPDLLQVVSVSGGVPSIRKSSTEFGEIFLNPDSPYESSTVNLNSCWKPHRDQAVDLSISSESSLLKFNPWENSTRFAACPVIGDMTGSGLVDTVYHRYQYNTTINMWESRDQFSYEPPITKALALSSFDSIMSNIAASLTNTAHELLGREVYGVVMNPEVYVVVNWYFIILPGVLIVLGILFLILTILHNRQRGHSHWKSSLLPVVYHGLAEDIGSDELGKASAMEKSALERTVTLGIVDNRRRLALGD
ncbi:hypothetical protein P170DRAFT_357764 [Aspergillus steynii IBT 23096]|uniref:Uncharacterized protein n=1 Tax=Aspergillus steynii IBT 23096 TaxID=1392250 RepID=A0A2I2G863_9EURO|nr:uncharacterized protein P170DRAFT_357764 [Aspergillus steynii IBT 23096]PLB49033.1 hypothetical protein P170DRAFT_357764 [Aspergillus steynii IBT 23096]